MSIRDPQGLATTSQIMEIMEWLASPDGGQLNTGQAIAIAREIALGRVPHVSIVSGAWSMYIGGKLQ